MDPQNRKRMIDQAIAVYGEIRPCEGRSLQECFTVQDGRVFFWFNDGSGNTHAIVHPQPSAPVLVSAAS